MIETKYLILGAGPAGLSLANMFLRDGETDFLVLEREMEAGGLCRSVMVGGHRLILEVGISLMCVMVRCWTSCSRLCRRTSGCYTKEKAVSVLMAC